MRCEIRLAENSDGNAIIELLNKVTLDLHGKKINQWSYPWDFEEIEIDIKNSNIYVITLDNLILGTFSLKEWDYNKLFHSTALKDLYLYRIAVLPEYQGRNVGVKVIEHACGISKIMGKELYLDCWAGNIKLKNFYLKAGLEYVGDFSENDYMVSVFRYR